MSEKPVIINLLILSLIAYLWTGFTYDSSLTVRAENPLKGAWQITEIHWITQDTTYSINKAQPGMILFAEEHYALMWTPTVDARKPFEVLSKPTEEEILAGFRSIVFNGGTYSYTDTTATTTAQIAKVPGFEGGQQLYAYDIKDKILELTMYDEIYPNGSKPEWSGKVKTQFILTKN